VLSRTENSADHNISKSNNHERSKQFTETISKPREAGVKIIVLKCGFSRIYACKVTVRHIILIKLKSMRASTAYYNQA